MEVGALTAEEKRELLAKLLAERAAGVAAAPLSVGQRALWFEYQLLPESTDYNLIFKARARPALVPEVLEQALRRVTQRHGQLRATFDVEAGEPVQRIQPEMGDGWFEYADATEWDEAAIAERLRADGRRPFDLINGPVVRVRLLGLADGESLLQFAVHHIVFDTRSLEIVLSETLDIYAALVRDAPVQLPPPPVSYSDYVDWQSRMLAGEEGARLRGFWGDRLGADLEPLDLPLDKPRPSVQGHRGDSVSLELTAELTDSLYALAREAGTTLFVVVLAGFQTLLHRYSGQADIVVGSPTATRTRKEFEATVGYFVNPVALRTDFGDTPTFRALLRRVRATVLDALEGQEYPFARVVEDLHPRRDSSRTPIFQALIDWEVVRRVGGDAAAGDQALGRMRRGEVDLEILRSTQQEGLFDLCLGMYESGGPLRGLLKFDADLFERPTVERMVGHLRCLLERVAADPDRRVGAVPMLAEAERRQLLVGWNDTAEDYPRDATLHDLVAVAAARTPDATAVTTGEKAWTYRQLEEEANRVASRLLALGVEKGSRVAISVERSPRMLAGLLGILKCGAAYVPLDPAYPNERLAYMIEDSRAAVLVTEAAVAAELPTADIPILDLDADDVADGRGADGCPPDGDPMSEAYVIYTSGSTGRPKGVRVHHRAVVNFLSTMARRPGLGAGDVLLAVTTISFDIHVLELFLPLVVGGRVEIAEREVAMDGRRLLERLDSSGATVMQATPTTWQVLLDAGWDRRRPLQLLCGGEALPKRLATDLLQVADSVWNVYGPTETTVWSSTDRVTAADDRITVGRPIGNTQLYILDRFDNPLPVGLIGELLIGGDGVTLGYTSPELTAERFVPNPFGDGRLYRTGDRARYLPDGRVQVLGRTDSQVKLRGFRIELGEIEAALEERPEIGSAVASVREVGGGERRLVAYCVGSSAEAPSDPEVRRSLRRRLPDYMVPSEIVWMEELPLAPNGKIDRSSLPDPPSRTARREAASGHGSDEESSPFERIMVELWKEVLETEEVSVFDTFFDLGGHSLLSLKVVERFAEATGYRMNPLELVSQTLRQSVAVYEDKARRGEKPPSPGLGKRILEALKPLRRG